MSETTRWDGPPIETWAQAWTPDQAADALKGLTAPWAVAGGWAIDLWLGGQTREHGDLEIAVPDAFFPEIQGRLENLGMALFEIEEGQVFALGPGEAPRRRSHQIWAADPAAWAWRMDVFREPGDAETWIYRRTGEFSAPRAWASGRSAAGIPYVAPQIVLLFKARHCRDKDEADFAKVAPLLSDDARAWLIASLRSVHPGHAWTERLLELR
ncbi:MAG TPA: hypothetical protein VGI95_18995 [Caulobacteraceae bacterium]|jgi:hypothetical protein